MIDRCETVDVGLHGRNSNHFTIFFHLAQTREEEVILFNVLGTKQAFFGPEVAIGRMLIALNEQ